MLPIAVREGELKFNASLQGGLSVRLLSVALLHRRASFRTDRGHNLRRTVKGNGGLNLGEATAVEF